MERKKKRKKNSNSIPLIFSIWELLYLEGKKMSHKSIPKMKSTNYNHGWAEYNEG